MGAMQKYETISDTANHFKPVLVSATGFKYACPKGEVRAKEFRRGNIKQAIYGWRNARVENVDDFKADDWGGHSLNVSPEPVVVTGVVNIPAEYPMILGGKPTVVRGKVISTGRAEKSVSEGFAEANTMVKEFQREDIWNKEKERLLKTHRGWFVAYQNGKRVALEPSLDRLVAALDEKLGTPRKPCEFHEIVERPPVRRGPSPRLWPTRAQG